MEHFISENNLIHFFKQDGKAFLDSHRTTGSFEIAPSKALYYEIYRCDANASDNKLSAGPNPVLVLCHGYTESCTKYHEMIYYFLQNGFHVFTYDQRGHGRSFRENTNPSVVHAENFDRDYVGDLDKLITQVVRPNFPQNPMYLFGHSMGGCVSLRYIELHPDTFLRCILTSPMVGIVTGSVPLWGARALAAFMKLIGKGTNTLIGQHDYRPDETFEDSASLSRARFDYYNELKENTPLFQQCAGDYNWFSTSARASALAISAKETEKIQIPVLLCEAAADTYVRKDRIAKLRKNLPTAEYHFYQNSKHEIFNSTDEVVSRYCDDIFDFLMRPCT